MVKILRCSRPKACWLNLAIIIYSWPVDNWNRHTLSVLKKTFDYLNIILKAFCWLFTLRNSIIYLSVHLFCVLCLISIWFFFFLQKVSFQVCIDGVTKMKRACKIICKRSLVRGRVESVKGQVCLWNINIRFKLKIQTGVSIADSVPHAKPARLSVRYAVSSIPSRVLPKT